MARSERQDGGTRSGAGTLARPGPRSRPQQAPEAGQQVPDQRRGRPGRPAPAQPPAGGRPASGGQRPDAGARTAGRRVPSARAAAQGPRVEQRSGAPQAAAAPPRSRVRRRAGVPPQAPPAGRTTGPQRVRVTGPQPAAGTGQRPQPPQAQPRAALGGLRAGSSHRMPFVLLLCGLLGGALISALVISTTLAEGSFQISKLQDSTSSLAKQRQALQDAVAQAQSPQRIAQRAAQLGMRRTREPQYLDLKNGKVTNTGPTWSGARNAPGYAP